MNNKKNLDKLRENYNNIQIPDELDNRVNEAINKKRFSHKKIFVSAASVVAVVGVINISPAFANALEEIPVIGDIVKVVRISNYSVDRNGFDVSIDVPKIEGLKNQELQDRINQEMEKEAKDLYNQYMKEIEELEKDNIPGREMVKSSVETKTNNENVLSLVVTKYEAQGSSNTTRKFYNINKNNETAITLEGMFNNKDYVSIISENIKNQMKERIKNNPNEYYWLDSEYPENDFKVIKKDQGFYINDKNELVICFDKYEVGPGSTGVTEFVIPSDVIDVNLG
ncbi:DUF3298/DUF4163 domain-containing protein [Romboutsia weinsteinii]|uniref:DUF3298/DUF4163 domain-containing protein n=1 Tax=Romboutsia weinsteinii TaxID=2020949 RepID=A0A371J3L4_9FIRM|nr:DUF3298 and DUF4163 domain-containing protein [Romboutsia weinsteinii]RDY27257.1 DUF3298/DUF4163 domain-containing protein [Romboutsia weinsteinii]